MRWLVIGLAMGAVAGCGMARSKADWWARLEQSGLKLRDNRLVIGKSREEFVKKMGEPDKTQAIGENTYWYYRCRDGEIQMVMMSMLLDAGQITTESINEF